MGMLALVEENNVFLNCARGSAETIARFQRLFRQVWQSIPNLQRWPILGWLIDQNGQGRVVVELSTMWADSKDCHGQLKNGQLRFNQVEFQKMPDDAALHVIAHELGHVLQHTQGIRPEILVCKQDIGNPSAVPKGFSASLGGVPNRIYKDGKGQWWGDMEDVEANADRIARAWDFPRRDLDEYERGRAKCGSHEVRYCLGVVTLRVDAEDQEEANQVAEGRLDRILDEHFADHSGWDIVEPEPPTERG